jgi:hypothetical protein
MQDGKNFSPRGHERQHPDLGFSKRYLRLKFQLMFLKTIVNITVDNDVKSLAE